MPLNRRPQGVRAPARGGPMVAVTCSGDPGDVTAYSGIPASLLGALRDAEVRSVALRGDLGAHGQVWLERALVLLGLRPQHLRHPRELRAVRQTLRAQAGMHRIAPIVRGPVVAHRLRRLPAIDGVIQYGSGFDLPPGCPAITYEDATFRQVTEEFPWPWLGQPSPGLVAHFDSQIRARYARARTCTFMSHWAASSAHHHYGVPWHKLRVVGAGRNHEPPCPPRDWSTPRALFVGRDWERKNGPAVLRAFSRLRERHPSARLDVVGAHPRFSVEGAHGHGPLSLARAPERVRVETLFAEATFFVMPSLHEPAGIVYAEAQAAGLASIATTSGGARTIVGEAGILVSPRDDEGLLAAMLQLASPDTAARLGALARRRAPLFTWRAVAERLLRGLAPVGLEVAHLSPFLSEP